MKSYKLFLESNQIEAILRNKFSDIDIYISEKPDFLTLSEIRIPDEKQKKGIGSKVMQELIDYADSNQKDIFLTPSDDFGVKKSLLVKFYKKFGFVPNKGSNKDFRSRETMIRNYE
jgi:predicted GNAT family acetyltransferase